MSAVTTSNKKLECYFSEDAKILIDACVEVGIDRDLAVSIAEKVFGEDMFVLPDEWEKVEWTKNLLNV